MAVLQDPCAVDISRVVRSVSDTLRRRGWDVKTARSPKSRSRYVHAERDGGRRRITVRISDHKPNRNTKFDYDFSPQFYSQKKFASSIDRKNRPPRRGRPPGWSPQRK